MRLTSTSRLRRILLRAILIVLVVGVVGILVLSFSIELGDKHALPFLRNPLTGQPCDHETNLCQGEIQEAIQKLESNSFNLPKFLWRGVLKY